MISTMRKKRVKLRRALTVWILLFCMIVSMLPVAASPPKETAAADVTVGSENWTHMGTNGSHEFYKDSDGNFKVQGRYFTNSKACLSAASKSRGRKPNISITKKEKCLRCISFRWSAVKKAIPVNGDIQATRGTKEQALAHIRKEGEYAEKGETSET